MNHLGFSERETQVRLYAELDKYPIRDANPFEFFHTFHETGNGWKVTSRSVEPWDDEIKRSDSPVFQKNSLTGFLQRWLFFEVLRSVLGAPPHTFVTRNHVTTVPLGELIQAWREEARSALPSQAHGRIVRAQRVLDQARHYVSKYCAARGLAPDELSPNWPVDPTVALSLMVLGETLGKSTLLLLGGPIVGLAGGSAP